MAGVLGVSITIRIPGPPVSWARPNGHGQRFTDKRVRAYGKHVRACAFAVVRVPVPWEWVDVVAYVTRHTRHPCDLDNAVKGVIDACNGLVWSDDSRISRLDIIRCTPDKAKAGIVLVVSDGHLRDTPE